MHSEMEALREELEMAEEMELAAAAGQSRLRLALRALSALTILCLVVALVTVTAGPGTSTRNVTLNTDGTAATTHVVIEQVAPAPAPVSADSVPPAPAPAAPSSPLDTCQGSSHSASTSYSSSQGLFPEVHLTVLYNAYLHREESWWRPLVEAQLQELHEFNLTRAASLSLHVVLGVNTSGLFDQAAELKLNAGAQLALSIHPTARVYRVRGNRHEYAGMAQLWDLLHESSRAERPAHIAAENHFVLYFHTKGMVNRWIGHEQSVARIRRNVRLTQAVVRPWQQIVQRFLADKQCAKAGWCSSDSGFMWFNFWFARATFLADMPRPELVADRYYYETWLGLHPTVKSEGGLSLCDANTGTIAEKKLGFTNLGACG